jgi:hypothetical protein
MKFKLIEKFDETRSMVQDYMYDAMDELNTASLEEYIQWFKSELTYYDDVVEQAVTDAYIEACDYGMIKGVEKTRLTSELKEYIESHTDIIDDTDELMKECPGHLQHELKIVLSKLDESLNEELLTESINTNLRKFLISLLDLYKYEWKTILKVSSVDDIVVHHINKDRTANSMTDLALMGDHYHRSMHGKYSKDNWDTSALTDYPHILVSNLLACVAETLINQNQQDESSVDNN